MVDFCPAAGGRFAWPTATLVAFLVASGALMSWPFRGERLLGPEEIGSDLANALLEVAFLTLFLALAPASVVAMVLRFRRGRGSARQQMKWFAYASLLTIVLLLLSLVVPGSPWTEVIFLTASPLLPIAIGIAILKYRLYDIDIIIHRTLVYGMLTATLGLVYLGGVFGIGGVLRSVTGQESNNLAVAASTLGVAALFGPAHAHIQGFIDRRFYRRKYDAARTLEGFAARLRDEVDLDAVIADLLAVVTETVQPVHASLWLKNTSLLS
jgi:hypothetical protein